MPDQKDPKDPQPDLPAVTHNLALGRYLRCACGAVFAVRQSPVPPWSVAGTQGVGKPVPEGNCPACWKPARFS